MSKRPPPESEAAEPEAQEGASPDLVPGRTPGMARTLLKGTSWQTLAQLAPLIVNLVLTPYIIHGLGLALYGVFLLVNSIQALMGTFHGGIGPSCERYLTIYAGRGDRDAATRLVTTMTFIVFGVVAVVLSIFYALVPTIVAFFPVVDVDRDGAVFLLATQILLLGVIQVRGVFQAVLFAQQRFAITSIALLVGHLVFTVGMIATIEMGAGLRGMAWTFVVQQVLGTLIIVPPALGYLTRSGFRLVDRALFGEFFGYAWKVQLSNWLDMLTQQSDTLIVGKASPEQLGFFGPGQTFAQQLRMLPLNAVGPMMAIIGRAVGAHGPRGAVADFARLQRMWVQGVVGWIAVGIPASYFGVVAWLHLGSDLPGLIAAILLLGHGFALLARVQVLWCLAMRRPGIDVWQGVAFLVLKVGLTLALVGVLGVVGVAIATSVAQLGAALLLLAIMRRTLEVPAPSPVRDIPWFAAIVALLLSGLCSFGVSRLVGSIIPPGPLGLFACGLAAAPAVLVYAAQTVGLRELVSRVRRRSS